MKTFHRLASGLIASALLSSFSVYADHHGGGHESSISMIDSSEFGINADEIAEIRSIAEQTYGAATDHAAQSTPWGNAYVQTEALRKALAKTE